MIRVYFDRNRFYEILNESGLTGNKICDPNDPSFIGWSRRTISRATKKGYMSEGLYKAINDKIDISKCVVGMTDSNENAIFPRLEKLERKVDELDEQLNLLRTESRILHTL